MTLAEIRNVFHGGPRRPMVWWLLALTIGLTALTQVQLRLQLGELERESADLHRRASQLVGQHDAHLTALSAIAIASAGQRGDLFLDVSAAVSRFYPRIKDIFLVPLEPSAESLGSAPLAAEHAEAIRQAAARSTGLPELMPHPVRAGHYFLVKRSPNSDAAIYALALAIDTAQLIASDAAFWSRDNVHVRLSLPTGESMAGAPGAEEAQFEQELASASQPLLMQTRVQLDLSNLLPAWQVLSIVLLVSFGYVLVAVGLKQRARIRAAEREAELRRVEAKLTHAMRVNAMGEMASGMAHELTQPLTAILAQLQAGQRLLARGDTERLALVLDDAVGQSRRGSEILDRLRNWSRPQRGQLEVIDLRDALSSVQALLGPEAERRHAALAVQVSPAGVYVLADQVEMEQVIHNLVRNALEAQDSQLDARVDIRLHVADASAVIEIADNGPGVDKSMLATLFAPFTTTRADGTGLGLALSQRLIERAGGEIFHVPRDCGATFRIVLPLADQAEAAAQ